MNRKHLLVNILVIFFLLLNKNISAQILTNGGFENWTTGISGYLDPDGWFTNNANGSPATVAQAPGRTGTYSVNLKSVFDGSVYVGGNMNFYYTGTLKPILLSGYWQGDFTTTLNSLDVSVFVADTAAHIVGSGSLHTPPLTNLTGWTAFDCPVSYSSSNVPAITIININLTTTAAITAGDIDDLTLTYVTGIGEIETIHLLGASLNYNLQSGSYILNADLLVPSAFDVNIYDVTGRKVHGKNYDLNSGHYEIPLSTEQLPEGIYLCRVIGNTMDKSVKFIK